MENRLVLPTTSQHQYLARNIFVGLLGINVLAQLMMALFMLIDFEQAADTVLKISYTNDMKILGIALGANLLFTAGILTLSVVWTLQNKQEGIILGAAFGVLAIIAGLLTFLVLDRVDGLTVDVLRGTLIVALSAFATHNIEQPTS